MDPIFLKFLTPRIDVHAIDLSPVSKILLPHSKASPLEDTDFKYFYRLIPKPLKMAFIYLKIVVKFVYLPSLIVQEVIMQI